MRQIENHKAVHLRVHTTEIATDKKKKKIWITSTDNKQENRTGLNLRNCNLFFSLEKKKYILIKNIIIITF